MNTLAYPHILVDKEGTARLERLPRIRVAQVVADHVGNGWSTAEILLQYPHLQPAEVHAALAYYFDHREEMDAKLSCELEAADEAAGRSASPLRQRLLAAARSESAA